MKRKTEDTLIKFWGDLKVHERALLMAVVNNYGKLDYVHMGVLPFVSVHKALQALQQARREDSAHILVFTRLIQKLQGTTVETAPHVQMNLILRHKRVMKRFGDRMARAQRVPFAAPFLTTAGLKWSLPKQAFVPDNEAKVYPMFTLTFVSKMDKEWSTFKLVCPKSLSNEMKNYLQRQCR